MKPISRAVPLSRANWARWESEKPARFTEEIVARSPTTTSPRRTLAALRGGERRRSSAGLVDSVRESGRGGSNVN